MERLISEFRTLFGSAGRETFRQFGATPGRLAWSAVLWAVGAAAYYGLLRAFGEDEPGAAVVSEFANVVGMIVIPAVIGFGLVFLWNLWMAPYRIQQGRLDALRADFAKLQSQNAETIAAFAAEQAARAQAAMDRVDSFLTTGENGESQATYNLMLRIQGIAEAAVVSNSKAYKEIIVNELMGPVRSAEMQHQYFSQHLQIFRDDISRLEQIIQDRVLSPQSPQELESKTPQ